MGSEVDRPRQCNDAIVAVEIATALADAFGVGVNDLPNFSCKLDGAESRVYPLEPLVARDQGDLHPVAPAWVNDEILKALVENWDIKLISNPRDDPAKMLPAFFQRRVHSVHPTFVNGLPRLNAAWAPGS